MLFSSPLQHSRYASFLRPPPNRTEIEKQNFPPPRSRVRNSPLTLAIAVIGEAPPQTHFFPAFGCWVTLLYFSTLLALLVTPFFSPSNVRFNSRRFPSHFTHSAVVRPTVAAILLGLSAATPCCTYVSSTDSTTTTSSTTIHTVLWLWRRRSRLAMMRALRCAQRDHTICSKNSSNRALIEFLIPCHYRQDVADAQNFLIRKVALHWTRRELPKILTEELCDFVETVT